MEQHKKKEKLMLHDTSFVDLMMKRIFNVLLIANPYDAFMLEDDGRVDEKIFNEYAKLGLRYPPRFFQVASQEEAEKELKRISFDLVICMPGTDNNDVFDIARNIKSDCPTVPIVVLTPFSHGIRKRMENEDLSIFEYVFCWLGNTDLLLSIIKLIEDKMNLAHDIEVAGVQMIMLVEDSIRFYSSILPNLYKFVLQQSLEFATEALNAQLETLRMRGRPKIVLARSYEEAWALYSRFKDNTLGVISDCRFPKDGKTDETAGYQLLSAIRASDEFVPLIMESSESDKAELAAKCGAAFIDKNSKKMDVDLRNLILKGFGFGDFIFRNPQTMEEVARIKNLKDLQNNIFTLPKESLLYHITRNNVSRWLCSRALFPISEFLKHITWHSLQDVDAHRQIIFDAIVSYRRMKNQGVVAVFHRDRFDRYSNFARIGEGSLGGKGRGIAFLDNIIKKHKDLNDFDNARVMIPKTVVLCTDVFDEFMDTNELYQIALSDIPDDEILQYFLHARLPEKLAEDLMTFLDVVREPIAIRSSSLLEDSHYQPFAGIYSTYMIPYTDDKYTRLRMLSDAIKGVYASVFYRDSKAYMTATSNVIDQEKMAVILQEVVGTQYGDRFYPNISGVARSVNYYPIGDEKAEEGTVNLALGLGKYIVDGGLNLRVCPAHPNQVLQTSEMEIALRETQTRFYALDLKNMTERFCVDDGFNLLKLSVREAEKDGSLQYIASTYDPYDMVIRDGIYDGGRKLITFCGVLQQGVFPLPELLRLVMRYGQEDMLRAVEIEFAVKLNPDRTGEFYLLQIRPMVDNKMMLDEDLEKIADEATLIRSHNAIGHGITTDVYDVVYVKTDNYLASNNPAIADEISKINAEFLENGRNYVLVGPGRWGSSDSWLGVPVKWPNISAAKVIVEAGLTNYRIDPSQGTHFFQNLTSFGVGYFTVNDFLGDGVYNQAFLNAHPAINETEHVRHVRFASPVVIKIDGMKKEGVVLLPED
ncbi:MAG: phosphoenolpyruvate synthase [Bacteroides sp.]|nr:phosphoenolpyruvate synthase [Roseburia sp.]MCM1347062.1 phosphoenolpyruvate synthase [Bacteroides sp.]MCM1420647.1 phosphoenolpyruvate synthase [Bacteroides sp.]